MQVYNELENFYKTGLGHKTILVSNEAESLQIKDILFGLGASVVSDRDVVTLDYLLTQKLIQKQGFRIIDDYLFPHLLSGGDKGKILEQIKWIKNFPDPFIESEIFEVLQEYFSSEEEYSHLKEKLSELFEMSQKVMSEKLIPRSFIKLGLESVLNSEDYIILETLFDELPMGFQQSYGGEVLKVKSDKSPWSQQIDLYKIMERQSAPVSFLNFEAQVDEVRFALKLMSESEVCPTFLFPQNQGYEVLFFTYQREFFKEQKFFFQNGEKSYLKDCIIELKSRIEVVETKYSQNSTNQNIVSIKESRDELISYEEVLNLFKGRFTEYDLNLLAPIAHQLLGNPSLVISSWIQILSEILNKENLKKNKLKTEFRLFNYSHFPTTTEDEIYILGWGNHLFKRNGDKIFQQSVMSGLERDLGLFLASLSKSPASDLMKNPLMWDESVSKKIMYSEKNALGASIKPGVFKILWDETDFIKPLDKVFNEKKYSFERPRLQSDVKRLSASSLQKYDECPYRFYLEKVIGLSVEDEEDYFLSAKEEGLLIHKALEEVKSKEMTKEEFTKNLESMIFSDQEDFNYFRKSSLSKFSDHLWCIIKSEKEYIKEKNIKSVEAERFFSYYADLKEKEFNRDEGDYKIVGVIDRIDVSSDNEAFLYDYKRGDSGSVSLGRYTGEGKLSPQLFLYCIATDKGFLGAFKDFLGFQYINVKTYKRMKGFVDKEKGKAFAKDCPQGSAIDEEKYGLKLELFLEKFWQILSRIDANDFKPKPNPSYAGICLSCDWRGVCKKSETFQ